MPDLDLSAVLARASVAKELCRESLDAYCIRIEESLDDIPQLVARVRELTEQLGHDKALREKLREAFINDPVGAWDDLMEERTRLRAENEQLRKAAEARVALTQSRVDAAGRSARLSDD